VCGRFSLGGTVRVGQLFELPNWPETPPRYNIAPSQEVSAVIRTRETAAREFRSFRWGLVPSWAKDSTLGNRLINARAETVAVKPAFRKPLRRASRSRHARSRPPGRTKSSDASMAGCR
jgi:putative SOS response-associated peptidase YedK